MPEHKLCVPCLFGLEGPLGNELRHMGLRDVMPENGRVRCTGSDADIARMNLRCRFGERVLLELGSFPAPTFDALFEGVKALPWADYLPADAAFPVKGYSLESALHSVPDCQKIIKKAVVSRLGAKYGQTWFDEIGEKYQIQFAIMHDVAELYLDTSGAGLHKRGYRANSNAAPLRETLAAAMVKLARWRGRDPFLDPFCGSGTIAIEAAMIAQRRAPGLLRRFDAEKWSCFDKSVWQQARESALDLAQPDAKFDIVGSDIDPDCVQLSIENARKAGVANTVFFERADATKRDYSNAGVLFANPPYGERLLDLQQAEKLYADLGRATKNSPMKQYLLSSDPLFERCYGRKADKRRKLYNGMIKCELHMYFKDPSASNRGENKHSDHPSAKRPAKR